MSENPFDETSDAPFEAEAVEPDPAPVETSVGGIETDEGGRPVMDEGGRPVRKDN